MRHLLTSSRETIGPRLQSRFFSFLEDRRLGPHGCGDGKTLRTIGPHLQSRFFFFFGRWKAWTTLWTGLSFLEDGRLDNPLDWVVSRSGKEEP